MSCFNTKLFYRFSVHPIEKRPTFALPKTRDCGTRDLETTKSPESRVSKSRVKQQQLTTPNYHFNDSTIKKSTSI